MIQRYGFFLRHPNKMQNIFEKSFFYFFSPKPLVYKIFVRTFVSQGKGVTRANKYY